MNLEDKTQKEDTYYDKSFKLLKGYGFQNPKYEELL